MVQYTTLISSLFFNVKDDFVYNITTTIYPLCPTSAWSHLEFLWSYSICSVFHLDKETDQNDFCALQANLDSIANVSFGVELFLPEMQVVSQYFVCSTKLSSNFVHCYLKRILIACKLVDHFIIDGKVNWLFTS